MHASLALVVSTLTAMIAELNSRFPTPPGQTPPRFAARVLSTSAQKRSLAVALGALPSDADLTSALLTSDAQAAQAAANDTNTANAKSALAAAQSAYSAATNA